MKFCQIIKNTNTNFILWKRNFTNPAGISNTLSNKVYNLVMKGLFGLVALLITIGIIIYAVSWQLELFQSRSISEGRGTYGEGSLYVTDQDDILAPIDRAEESKRALEVKSRIPDSLLQ